MSFDFSTLITDRTNADAYFASDLNRVSICMDFLVDTLYSLGVNVDGYQRITVPEGQTGAGLSVWRDVSWVTPAVLEQYLQNVEAVRAALAVAKDTPKTPKEVRWSAEANDIEKIFLSVERSVNEMRKVFLQSAQPLSFCGFAVYPVTKPVTIQPDDGGEVAGLRLYTADGLAVYTADGFAVYLNQ